MLFWEITNIYCRKRTKETKTHCGNNGESLNVTVGGTHMSLGFKWLNTQKRYSTLQRHSC